MTKKEYYDKLEELNEREADLWRELRKVENLDGDYFQQIQWIEIDIETLHKERFNLTTRFLLS